MSENELLSNHPLLSGLLHFLRDLRDFVVHSHFKPGNSFKQAIEHDSTNGGSNRWEGGGTTKPRRARRGRKEGGWPRWERQAM
jgi:hypothetical protein